MKVEFNYCASPPLPAHTATPRTDAAMAQQQTFNVWHNSQFRKLFGRRVVAPPVVAAAVAALATHGRAHSVPQQAGGPPAGFQPLPTASWRFALAFRVGVLVSL